MASENIKQSLKDSGLIDVIEHCSGRRKWQQYGGNGIHRTRERPSAVPK